MSGRLPVESPVMGPMPLDPSVESMGGLGWLIAYGSA